MYRIRTVTGEQNALVSGRFQFDAQAAVSSRLMGKDYEAVQEMLYPQNAKQVWQAAVPPAVCSHYFMLDKTLYGFFPEEQLVVDYHSGAAAGLTAPASSACPTSAT